MRTPIEGATHGTLDPARGCNLYPWDVTTFRISELADRSGVPTSTLRYYERIGLVEPVARTGNGYRVYDETTVERLAFIGRAKRLGMGLDDVATLVGAWFAGDCEPLHDRLRAFVSGRLSDVRRQLAEDGAFERQLERILARLSAAGPLPERCRPDCGCDTDPLQGTDGASTAAVGCSLDADGLAGRVHEWRELLARAAFVQRTGVTIIAGFDQSPALLAEITGLCAAEVACCPFFDFTIAVAADAVTLTVGGPDGAADLLDAVSATAHPLGVERPAATAALVDR